MDQRRAFDTTSYEIEAQLRELRRLVAESVILSDAQETLVEGLIASLTKVSRVAASLRHALLTGDAEPMTPEEPMGMLPDVVDDPEDSTEPVEDGTAETTGGSEAGQMAGDSPELSQPPKTFHLGFNTRLESYFADLQSQWGSRFREAGESDDKPVTRFYTARDAEGKGYFILDDRSNAGRLDNPDDRLIRERMLDRLITVHEFDSLVDARKYVTEHFAIIQRVLRESTEYRQDDSEGDAGSPPVPALVGSPVGGRPGGAARTFEEAQAPPRNP